MARAVPDGGLAEAPALRGDHGELGEARALEPEVPLSEALAPYPSRVPVDEIHPQFQLENGERNPLRELEASGVAPKKPPA